MAVARHVDDGLPAGKVEEDELLRAAGGTGGAGERPAPGQRIDEARFPTFDRPANAISSPVIGGRLSIALAAHTNPASPAKSLRPDSR